MVEVPCYLKIRADEEANVIRAWYAMTDGSEEREVATLSIHLANEDKQAYLDWVSVLKAAHVRFIESVSGLKVMTVHHRKPCDNN